MHLFRCENNNTYTASCETRSIDLVQMYEIETGFINEQSYCVFKTH